MNFKEIVIGTTNPAKANQIRQALPAYLQPFLVSRQEVGEIKVEEDGQTAAENAAKKASAYASHLGLPVLAMDNALYFDVENFPPDKQPGLQVRRIGDQAERPTDNKLIGYYTQLIGQYADRYGLLPAHWDFALCLALPDGQLFERTIRSPRLFTNRPSEIIIPGYPLESLQIDPETESYISEMNPEEQAAFWKKTIGEELTSFVTQVLSFDSANPHG